MNYSVELPSGKVVSHRRMRFSDENIILDKNLAKEGNSIHKFLSEICDIPIEEVKELYVGDSTYLVMDIRIKNKGKDFDPNVICPFCEKSSRFLIDLEKHIEENTVWLNRDEIDDNDQFVIELPVSGHKLTMKFLTEKNVNDCRKEISKFSDKTMTYTMLFRTVSIVDKNGDCVMKTTKFFDELDIEDSDHLKEEYDRLDFGVETEIYCKCQHCGMAFKYEIPFNKDFFLRRSPVRKI